MDLLTQAIRQAEAFAPGPWRLRKGALAAPVLFQMGLHRQTGEGDTFAAQLTQRMQSQDTWFAGALAEGGYLNLPLREAWYTAVAAEPVTPGPPCSTPTPNIPAFPAEILLGDWRFLCRTEKATPPAALAARQDRENPAWLVRYTAQRLASLSQRPEPEADGKINRSLLEQAAEYPQRSRTDPPRQLGRYLVRLAQAIWQERAFYGSTAQHCGQVLAAGYQQLSG